MLASSITCSRFFLRLLQLRVRDLGVVLQQREFRYSRPRLNQPLIPTHLMHVPAEIPKCVQMRPGLVVQ